jgi:hypothetical protein
MEGRENIIEKGRRKEKARNEGSRRMIYEDSREGAHSNFTALKSESTVLWL